MAVTTQVDNRKYDCLIRKVGYSYGLESLRSNVLQLAELYAEKGAIPLDAWLELVKSWRSNEEAPHHYSNLYSQLYLVKSYGKTIHPLYGLETLSILSRFFGDQKELFHKSADAVLAQLILEADGEIFLNALSVGFVPEKFGAVLEKLIFFKRQAIDRVFKSRAIRERIYRIIDIENQTTDQDGGRLAHTEKNNFAKRTGNLSEQGRRTEPLTGAIDTTVRISKDYLRKAPQTRKGWAKDLGLFDADQSTEAGKKFLSALESLGLKTPEGVFVFWPYPQNLLDLSINVVDLNVPKPVQTLNNWKLVCAIVEGLSGLQVEPYKPAANYEEPMDLLLRIQRLYREGSSGKESIRHHLPLDVARPCVAAIAFARQQPIPPLTEILGAEFTKPKRRVNEVSIRGTNGGLMFAKDI